MAFTPPTGLVDTATGSPVADPLQTIAKAHVQAYAAIRGNQAASGDNAPAQAPAPRRTIDTEDQATPPPMRARKFDLNGDPVQQEQQGFQDKSDALQREADQERQLGAQQQQAITDAGRAASFNKDSYKAKRISEMQPTQDLDTAIMQLRQKAVYDQAALWDQLQGVPLPKAMQVMNERQDEYARQINDLAKMRETRLKEANDQVDQEIGTYEGQINASKTKVEAIKSAIDTAKSQGTAEADMAQLHIDAAKEAARLNKTRAGKGGLATSDETAIAYIAATNNIPKSKATEIWKAAKAGGTTDYKAVPDTLLPPKSKKTISDMADLIRSGKADQLTPSERAAYKKAQAAEQAPAASSSWWPF